MESSTPIKRKNSSITAAHMADGVRATLDHADRSEGLRVMRNPYATIVSTRRYMKMSVQRKTKYGIGYSNRIRGSAMV